MILDIGVGKKPLGNINLDVVANPLCDIIGDIQFLPFRDASISKVVCKAVLEHVDYPHLAIFEVKRVLIIGGIAEIGVPKENFTSNSVYYLFYFILNFPVSIIYFRRILRKLILVRNRDVRVFHKYIIPKTFIQKYFNIEEIIEYGDILYSFLNYGKKSIYFRNKPRVNTAYLFFCRKGI